MNIETNQKGETINPLVFLLSNLLAISIILFVYLINAKDKFRVVDTFKKLTVPHLKYFMFNALASMTATFLFVFVLKKGAISKLFPTIQATVIISSFFLGSYLLKESISTLQMIAIGMISVGIIALNV